MGEILARFLASYLGFFVAVWEFTAAGGWVVLVLFLFALLYKTYMVTIQKRYVDSLEWLFLCVRVPEDNPRTPRSMEEVLNAFHGIQKPPDLFETYLDGYVQAWISMEIRGTPEGVSFFLRIPAKDRQTIEAAIYAQYPDAEIEEAADYAEPYTLDRLERDVDLWGSEMILVKEDAYPIKTYVDFEDQMAPDERLVDPMAAVTELVSNLNPGEEVWVQILIRPVFADRWVREGMNLALTLAGREVPKRQTALQKSFALLGHAVSAIVPEPAAELRRRDTKLDLGALRLTPGETEIVRAIQRNVSKVAFQCQIRVAYVSPLEIHQRRARIPAIFGLFRQFSSFTLNGFFPSARFTTSRPTYAAVNVRRRWRKRRLLTRYRRRFFREAGFILNVEELATIYHYPVQYARAPAIERARAKRGEAPQDLPLASEDITLP